MSGLSLSFESGEETLDVRSFTLQEAMSECFRASIVARSANDDLDLDALVGRPAELRVDSPRGDSTRRFRGVCMAAEQIAVEETGLSTYEIVVGPLLGLLAHRVRYRVFQRLSIPEIVLDVLREWNIDAQVNLVAGQFPKLEYRVQFAESDLTFVSRLLEEAGISYTFPTENRENGDPPADILLEDAADANPISAELTHMQSVSPSASGAWASKVRVGRHLRTGRVVLSDQSFRSPVTTKLFGDARVEELAHLELHQHAVGASVVMADRAQTETPVADGLGASRAEQSMIDQRARTTLTAERGRRRQVWFETNVMSLRPGSTVRIDGHPRAELVRDRLLVVGLQTKGGTDQNFRVEARALFTDLPYKPIAITAKPSVPGIQTAVVVGPANADEASSNDQSEDIHTDEFGRVRVQFAWDREGVFNERSSCFLRVSQSWAGGGHSAFSLPRVGDEVIVGFFDGNPDQPVVIGRLHNASSPVPYALPASKTVSGWRTASSPATGGFNELRFEDAAGSEVVSVQAERDYQKLVKNDESITVGANRVLRVGQTDDSVAGLRHSITVAPLGGPSDEGETTRIVTTQSKIVLTTGQAKVTVDGPNITFEAMGTLTLKGTTGIRLESAKGDIVVQGGPYVRINPRGAGEPLASAAPLDFPIGETPEKLSDEVAEVAENAWFDPADPTYFDDAVGPGGPLSPYAKGATPEENVFRAFNAAISGRDHCQGRRSVRVMASNEGPQKKNAWNSRRSLLENDDASRASALSSPCRPFQGNRQ